MTQTLLLGRISAAYGLRGWLKVYSDTDPIGQILDYSPWYLRKDGSELQLEVIEGKAQGKSLIVLLAGLKDRTQAEGLIGHEVWIDQAKLPGLEQGEYYWHQLEGLKVVNLSGAVLGRVEHLMVTGANDVMVVKPVSGSIDHTERLIPFVQDEVVKEVNIGASMIVVAWKSDY